MKVLGNLLEPAADPEEEPKGRRRALLALAALGIVYGDIGTSPLYAVRECFAAVHGLDPTPENVLGILSLILWSLVVVVSLKYLVYVMRADNRGEGGILALMALVHPPDSEKKRSRLALAAMGLFGAALLYGDGTITPAISVLSAVEGLEVTAPTLEPYVLPVTVAILLGLFLFQRRGTGGIGAIFGPLMLVWFGVLACLGVSGIAQRPDVLRAVAPDHAIGFFLHHGTAGIIVLSAVFLVVTGGEALYADMGHFGKGPIRLAWFAVVLPCLLLNYFGQGALLLRDPLAVRNPFYLLAPSWASYPLVGLAAIATVIASQAVISGSFSLTRQAIQLGYSPRLKIEHTSSEQIGQVYLPSVNFWLALVTIGLVLGFRRSENLAGAYGVAVATTMVITTILAFVVARERWEWGAWAAVAVTAPLLVVDLAFFGANLLKIGHGGWFPILLAAVVFTLLSTWRKGKLLIRQRMGRSKKSIERLIGELKKKPVHRVHGTAVFMTGELKGVPTALLAQIRHNRVLHKKVVLLTIVTEPVPRVPAKDRIAIEDLGEGFLRVVAHYGFMQEPRVPVLLRMGEELGIDPDDTTFFLGHETVVPTPEFGMRVWRAKVYRFMMRNAEPASSFFHIPPERVVELGVEVEL